MFLCLEDISITIFILHKTIVFYSNFVFTINWMGSLLGRGDAFKPGFTGRGEELKKF